jgi:uncharacterized Zn finger protein
MAWYGDYGRWKPYVPVARRRANAAGFAARLAKKEKRALAPVKIEGRKIAQSFWGQAWCDHLEKYSDFANRLPRGRTYVRNGSVVDLQIMHGKIKAFVAGSEVYTVTISIGTLGKAAWKRIKSDCSRSIDSLIDLLQGRFDQGIMQRLTHREAGLFPQPAEIKMDCSCPDWATMCKHVAAVLYGVGARLDSEPEMLFKLRAVDHLELISQAVAADNLDATLAAGQAGALAGSDLGELFGIEIEAGDRADATAAAISRVASKGKKLRLVRKRSAAAASSVQIPSKCRKAAAKPINGAAGKVARNVTKAPGKPVVTAVTRKKASRS